MATLRHTATGKTIRLEAEHVVGRGPTCALRLQPKYVSNQHAVLRWVDAHWEVKDLASSNGTFVNGKPVEHGRPTVASAGATFAFGHADQVWELVDASPPDVLLVPVDGGDALVLETMLALPSPDDPQATIYRGPGGFWVLEQDDAVRPLSNGQVFFACGGAWRFSCDERDATWRGAGVEAGPLMRDFTFAFTTSISEEFIRLQIHAGTRTHDVGQRVFNLLLLTLARQRQADAEQGVPESECGWVYTDVLAQKLGVATTQLVNLYVFRARERMKELGLTDPAGVIERRPSTHELRLGASRFTVAPG